MADTRDPDDAPARRGVPRAAIFAAVALLAGAGYGAFRFYQARQPYEWSGTVEARTITVGSRTGGRIKEVLVHEGDRVEAKQVLLVLEPGSLEAQRAQAEGALAEAEATRDKQVAGARPEEVAQANARAAQATAALQESRAGARHEDVAAAKARLSSAQATADKAAADAERSRILLQKGAVTQAELDTAVTTARTAAAERDAQQQQVDALVHGTRREDVQQAAARAAEAMAAARLTEAGSRVEDIRGAEAMVRSAQGRLAQVVADIDELTIRAPRAARVEALDLRPGDILGPNAPAATLLEDGELYVRIYVPETQLGFVRPGQEVPVFIDSFPRQGFRGQVRHIAEVGEFSPRNLQTADERADQVFATRVDLIEGQGVLRAGMAAFVRVPK